MSSIPNRRGPRSLSPIGGLTAGAAVLAARGFVGHFIIVNDGSKQ
jgi:hypothetical protein